MQVLEGGGGCSQTAAYSSHNGHNGYTSFDAYAQTDSRASVKSVSEAVRASTNQVKP
jgi:hypothetical protein